MQTFGYIYRRITSADEALFSQLTEEDLSAGSLRRCEDGDPRKYTLAHVLAWNNKRGRFHRVAKNDQDRILDLTDSSDNTVLHVACQEGSLEGIYPELFTLERLLRKNRRGHIPFDTHKTISIEPLQASFVRELLGREKGGGVPPGTLALIRKKLEEARSQHS